MSGVFGLTGVDLGLSGGYTIVPAVTRAVHRGVAAEVAVLVRILQQVFRLCV